MFTRMKAPNILERGVDKILLGASHYRMEAESSGTSILGSCKMVPAIVMFRQISPTDGFLLFPRWSEYVFEIGGKEHPIKYPQSLIWMNYYPRNLPV